MTQSGRSLYHFFQKWLPVAISFSILCLLVYAVIQQSFRQSANDPQIQLAEDAAYELSVGAEPKTVLPEKRVDISRSLSPYVIIYDESGAPVAGSGVLDGQPPRLPEGVFDFTREHGENRITWQPRPDVRSAIVVVHYTSEENSGFVMAGRSLREIEIRESRLSLIVLLTWVAGLFATLILSAL